MPCTAAHPKMCYCGGTLGERHWGAHLKIKRIETFSTEFIGFVRITTDDGATGIGQVSTYNSDITSTVLHRQVAPHVLGLEFDSIDALSDMVIEREHKFPGSYMKRALGDRKSTRLN